MRLPQTLLTAATILRSHHPPSGAPSLDLTRIEYHLHGSASTVRRAPPDSDSDTIAVISFGLKSIHETAATVTHQVERAGAKICSNSYVARVLLDYFTELGGRSHGLAKAMDRYDPFEDVDEQRRVVDLFVSEFVEPNVKAFGRSLDAVAVIGGEKWTERVCPFAGNYVDGLDDLVDSYGEMKLATYGLLPVLGDRVRESGNVVEEYVEWTIGNFSEKVTGRGRTGAMLAVDSL